MMLHHDDRHARHDPPPTAAEDTRVHDAVAVTHCPMMVYTLFRCACLEYVKKNCEPMVFAPLLAIDNTPR